MKVNSRDGRPSYLSKSVMKVYRRNRTEAVKLNETLHRLDKCKVHSLNNITDNISSLRQTSRKIKSVVNEMDISEMRRRFIVDQGQKITENKMNITELLERVDAAIRNPIGKTIVIQKSKTSEINSENIKDEINNLDEKKKDLDVIKTDNETHDETRPFQFRKITPPLKGRKMEEVYKELKEEGKMMSVEELEDFPRGSKEFEIVTTRKLKEQDKGRNESCNAACQDQNEITKLKKSFEHLLDNESKLQCYDETSDAEFGYEALLLTRNEKGQSKVVQNNIRVEKAKKREKISKSIRPFSSPPKGFANSPKETGRHRRLVNSHKVVEQHQVRRCWDEHESAKMKAESKSSPKHKKMVEKLRPKSCTNSMPYERMGMRSRPASQRKLLGMQTTESNSGGRNPSCGNQLKVDKELVYDARPKDAITSGYATLRMTIGRKSTGLYVPKFKRFLTENEEITEKQRTNKFDMERRRIQRVKRQLELDEHVV